MMTPTIAITMGDAAGIGPEIIAAAWKTITQTHSCRFVVYGNPVVMQRAAKQWGQNVEIPVISCGSNDVADVLPGQADARTGEAAYQAIVQATDDTLAGKNAAIVTAPIHKAALNTAGYLYPGHTEILAERCGVQSFAMMLYLAAGGSIAGQYGLAVDHVTLHCAMSSVFEQITVENILAKAHLVNRFMQKMGKEQPHIGVCSLNPHNGEEGLFGREEIDIIRPAVKKGQQEGLNIALPCPADTMMLDARDGKYDAVVAMFHDQGHIALKLLGMYQAVNVTLGLPIIRTSPAHGTALDKAGRGIAHPEGLIAAVHTALQLCRKV